MGRETGRVMIGEAARRVEVEAHVLRHWESVGVIVPSRDAGGRRDYGSGDVVKGRIVRACQELGMSLREVASILLDSRASRRFVIERRLAHIAEQRAKLDAAEEFLRHVIDCRATDVSQCNGWRRYAGLGPGQADLTRTE